MARIARRQSGTDIYHGILRGDTTLLWQFGGGYVELNANGTPTSWNYYVTDHLGSTRMVVDSNDSIRETINYYPFGSEMKMENPALLNSDYWQRFRFTGKELVKTNDLNMYDFGARWYDVAGVPMWTSIDPLAEKYYNVSPYVYCNNNPVMMIDYDGMDWYSTSDTISNNGQSSIFRTMHYTDLRSQDQLNENGITGEYLGETVVVFNGFYDEKLGSDNCLDGPGAKPATATVYGEEGADDITDYIAFTMTSDFNKYGAIADGCYDGSWRPSAGSGTIPKHYILNGLKPIDTIDGNRSKGGYSETQKDGICIHRTNNNGTAHGRVSVGCLLIAAKQWTQFENKIGKKPFKVILQRQ